MKMNLKFEKDVTCSWCGCPNCMIHIIGIYNGGKKIKHRAYACMDCGRITVV